METYGNLCNVFMFCLAKEILAIWTFNKLPHTSVMLSVSRVILSSLGVLSLSAAQNQYFYGQHLPKVKAISDWFYCNLFPYFHKYLTLKAGEMFSLVESSSAGTSPTFWTRGLAFLGLAGTRGLASPKEDLLSF